MHSPLAAAATYSAVAVSRLAAIGRRCDLSGLPVGGLPAAAVRRRGEPSPPGHPSSVAADRGDRSGADLRDKRGRKPKPLNAASLSKLVSTLAAILEDAIEDGHLDRNGAEKQGRPTIKSSLTSLRLSHQSETLLARSSSARYHSVVRPSEGVEWKESTMEARKIATRSLVPALAIGVTAAAVPATAVAGTDLCAYECGGQWGAHSHANADALKHYSKIESTFCSDYDPGAGAGQKQWYCNGKGYAAGGWHFYSLYLSPYGYSINGHYPT
jgi:hypothetical protein